MEGSSVAECFQIVVWVGTSLAVQNSVWKVTEIYHKEDLVALDLVACTLL